MAKKLVVRTGKAQVIGDEYVYPNPKDSTKTLSVPVKLKLPDRPALTGDKLLDKQLISKFNGKVTTEVNNVMERLEVGLISTKEASQQIKALQDFKTGVTSSGKGRKVPKLISDAELIASFKKAMQAANPPHKPTSKAGIQVIRPIKLKRQTVKSLTR